MSTKALARAKSGVYGKRAMLSVPQDVVSRYFEETASGDFRIGERARSHVDFGYQNLIREPYPLSLMGNWDIIFCRNVTIYFKLESTRRVVSNFYESLNEGGYLFVGHSETLTSVNDDFEPVEVGGVFLYRKPMARRTFAFGQSATRSVKAAKPVARPPRVRPPVSSSPPVTSAPPAGGDTIEQARIDLQEGRPARVLEIVSTILASDPNNAEAHLLSAYVHADVGDYDEAMRDADRALAINPLLPVARYILGIINQRQGDAVRAVSELKKTIYIDADFALAHLNLANIYKSQRKWDHATKEYENALRSMYKNPDGAWTEFAGGFQADLLVRTCERSLLECRKAMGGG